MGLRRLQVSDSQIAQPSAHRAQQGFAMVSLMIMIPLLMALAMALGTCFFVFKRKSLAQSICLQEATRLQDNLRVPLKQLMKMNAGATRLRAQRKIADRALATALETGVPPAIASAQAAQIAVILAQTAYRARQMALLSEATALRAEGQRNLHSRAVGLGAYGVKSLEYYWRALAVEPFPLGTLTPDYRPVPGFQFAQQQRFIYQIDLLQGWPAPVDDKLPRTQATECSVTLKGEDQQWQIRILAANASSSF